MSHHSFLAELVLSTHGVLENVLWSKVFDGGNGQSLELSFSTWLVVQPFEKSNLANPRLVQIQSTCCRGMAGMG